MRRIHPIHEPPAIERSGSACHSALGAESGSRSMVAGLASAGLHRFFPKTSRRFLPLQPDRAIEQLRKTLEREPNFVVARWRLARAYAQKVMYQEAISELQNAIAVAGRRPYYGWTRLTMSASLR